MIFFRLLTIIIVFVSTKSLLLENQKSYYQNKFTAALHTFLTEYAEENSHDAVDKPSQHQQVKIHYANVVRMLSVIEQKIKPKVLLQQCGNPQQMEGAADVEISPMPLPQFLSDNFVELFHRSGTGYWTLSDTTSIAAESGNHKTVKNIPQDVLRHLLTWLLAFGARMGYTVGSMAMNQQENGAERIKLEHFIIAIKCLGLQQRAHNHPMIMVAEDGGKMLSINFDSNDRDQDRIAFNFETLSHLVRSEKQYVHELTDKIESISKNGYDDFISKFYSRSYGPLSLMDRLVMTWTGRTDQEESEKVHPGHTMYMLKRYGHGLALRLLGSKELERYFQQFSEARLKLDQLANDLAAQMTDKHMQIDKEFGDKTQGLLHYEDAVQIEMDLKQVIEPLMRTTEKWHEKLGNVENIDEFFKTIREIDNKKSTAKECREFDYYLLVEKASGKKREEETVDELEKVHSELNEATRTSLTYEAFQLLNKIYGLKKTKDTSIKKKFSPSLKQDIKTAEIELDNFWEKHSIKNIDEFFQAIRGIDIEKSNANEGKQFAHQLMAKGKAGKKEEEGTSELGNVWREFSSQFSKLNEEIRTSLTYEAVLVLSKIYRLMKESDKSVKGKHNTLEQQMMEAESELDNLWKSCKEKAGQLAYKSTELIDELKKVWQTEIVLGNMKKYHVVRKLEREGNKPQQQHVRKVL